MARPRKIIHVPPAEAGFILEALMRDGRIDSKMIDEYRARYLEEIASLEARLAQLRELSGAVTTPSATAVAAPGIARIAKRVSRRTTKRAKSKAKKAAMKISPERARTRKLQGKYLGLMRQIPKTVVKQRFGKEAIAEKGKQAVLVEMEKYLSGKRKS